MDFPFTASLENFVAGETSRNLKTGFHQELHFE
jgi:hypothetical protein